MRRSMRIQPPIPEDSSVREENSQTMLLRSAPNRTESSRRIARILGRCRAHPGYAFRVGRGYVLFLLAAMGRCVWPLRHVRLGSNVRVQRNGSLFVEPSVAEISIGDDSIVYEDSKLEAFGAGHISLGPSGILGGVRITSRYRVAIGARFLASWNVFIQDFDPHPLAPEDRAEQVRGIVEGFRPRFHSIPRGARLLGSRWHFPGEPVEIGDDVWVGANATILKGVTIGSGSIVATGAVVTRGTYPPRSIIAGNPARVVKTINPPAATDSPLKELVP
jgi:acetyltransferase-like isoleucine patch superfamily enzyme